MFEFSLQSSLFLSIAFGKLREDSFGLSALRKLLPSMLM